MTITYLGFCFAWAFWISTGEGSLREKQLWYLFGWIVFSLIAFEL